MQGTITGGKAMTDQEKLLSQISARCWSDPAFKQQLLSDPYGTLKSEGVNVPEGMRINVVENTEMVFNFVITAKQIDTPDELFGWRCGKNYWDVC